MHVIGWDTAEQAAGHERAPRADRRTVLVATVLTVLGGCAAGVLAALLWVWLADPPAYVKAGDTAYLYPIEQSRLFGIEVDFTLACLLVSVPFGALVGALWYRVGWPQAFTLLVAGCLGAVVAWQLGMALGPDDVRSVLAAATDGERIPHPLTVDSTGLLLTFPVGALVGFVLAVGWFDRDESKPAPSTDGQTGAEQPAQNRADVAEQDVADPREV